MRELSLSARAKTAEARLKKLGRLALRPLVDVLRAADPKLHATGHRLLKAIFGQDLPPKVEPWLKYLQTRR